MKWKHTRQTNDSRNEAKEELWVNVEQLTYIFLDIFTHHTFLLRRSVWIQKLSTHKYDWRKLLSILRWIPYAVLNPQPLKLSCLSSLFILILKLHRHSLSPPHAGSSSITLVIEHTLLPQSDECTDGPTLCLTSWTIDFTAFPTRCPYPQLQAYWQPSSFPHCQPSFSTSLPRPMLENPRAGPR